MNTPQFIANALSKRVSYNIGRLLIEIGLNMDRLGCKYTGDISYL